MSQANFEAMLTREIDAAVAVKQSMRKLGPTIFAIAQELLACWQRGGKVLTAGNGGSAADAMHLAEELVVRYKKNRRALAAIALLDPTMLTCAGNDFGYERVFSRQVEALGNAHDVIVLYSTSGQSASILQAAKVAREKGMKVIGMSGKDGGALASLCDVCLIIQSDVTARIQEGHGLVYHLLCEWIDSQVD